MPVLAGAGGGCFEEHRAAYEAREVLSKRRLNGLNDSQIPRGDRLHVGRNVNVKYILSDLISIQISALVRYY